MPDFPKDGSEIAFGHMVDPIVKAIRFAYTLKRKNEEKDIPWKGPNIGEADRLVSPQPHEQLKAAYLAEREEDQGHDALVELVSLAVRLGIEQGRRIDGQSAKLNRILESIGPLLDAREKKTNVDNDDAVHDAGN